MKDTEAGPGHRLARMLTFLALASGTACGSSSSSAPASSEDNVDNGSGSSSGSSGSNSGGSNSGSSGSSSGGSSSGAVTSSGSGGSSSGGTASSSGASALGTDAGAKLDGGAVWHPSSSAPIHFHWMIGASSFGSGDILSGQDGQVVYDIDGEGATAADVAAIHAAGAIAVCYVDVGTLEQGRSDVTSFPSSVVGPGVQGWPGENWLLVTAANQSTILPLMRARFVNWCQAKGFDAIEPDNLDAWTNISNVTEADNVTYDLAIGQLAHGLALSIGLKNVMTDLATSQYASFLAVYDWALNEQCYEYGECGAYTAAGSFLPAGKAVFDVEYNTAPNCAQADQDHINAQKTDLDLVGATDTGYLYTPCVPDSQTTW
jgi:hypothetical protein